MNLSTYKKLCKEIEDREKAVEDAKRESYTIGDEDVLANFKRDAAAAKISPMQNWLTHYLKQHAAIMSFIHNPDVEPSEPLISRVGDSRTYLKLLVALAVDEGRDVGADAIYFPEGYGKEGFGAITIPTYQEREGEPLTFETLYSLDIKDKLHDPEK